MTGTVSTLSSFLLSALMLGGFVLIAGGITMIVRRRDRTKSVLMIICGLVMWGNVAIMTL